MKKLLLLLLLCTPLFLSSCGNDDDDETYCWEFEITQVTTIVGASPSDEPQTVVSKTTQCGLTESQANEVVKGLTGEQTLTSGDLTIKVKTTATKKRQ